MEDDAAKLLGEKLIGEVNVEGLAESLDALRALAFQDSEAQYFGIPELDNLVGKHPPASRTTLTQGQPREATGSERDLWDSEDDRIANSIANVAPKPPSSSQKPPIVELISPSSAHHPPGPGKTSLIYLITSLAILPATISSISISGSDAAVIIFDPLSHFSTSRLTEVMISHIYACLSAQMSPEYIESIKNEVIGVVQRALVHVHVLKPQSWGSWIESLKGLDEYLFDNTWHKSNNRRIHSLIMEDIDAFHHSIRSTSSSMTIRSTTISATTINPLTTASQTLTSSLLRLSKLLSCGVILTSRSTTGSSFRPSIPTIWPPGTALTRLAVRRIEVLKFVSELSAEEAEAERGKRWEVVRRGRFECRKVASGSSAGEGDGERASFVFRIGKGIDVEKDNK